jgi:hypothetical protein
MTPALEQHHQPNLRKLKRSAYVPSLPLEVWILIFFQNTDPSHLYTIGRQVCSAWRTEIPKVIAKKYLEDPTMVQIHSHCETSRLKRFACLLGPELGFSHYQGSANDRAVFKPIYKALEAPDHHEPECNTMYGRARRRGSQSVDDLRLPIAHDHGNRIQHVGGKHVDLPPCQIRIKDWYYNVHNHKHSGRFDTCYEDMALRGFQGLEWPEERIRPCAEDSDEKERMKLRYQAYSALGLVDWIVYDRKVPTWNRNEIASYWETLATRILFAETPVDQHRSMDEITRTELFRRLEDTTTQPLLNMEFDHEDDLHPCGQSAYWTSVQTPREDSDDYQTENDSTKAKLHERREKEKVYAAIWLGRSRV